MSWTPKNPGPRYPHRGQSRHRRNHRQPIASAAVSWRNQPNISSKYTSIVSIDIYIYHHCYNLFKSSIWKKTKQNTQLIELDALYLTASDQQPPRWLHVEPLPWPLGQHPGATASRIIHGYRHAASLSKTSKTQLGLGKHASLQVPWMLSQHGNKVQPFWISNMNEYDNNARKTCPHNIYYNDVMRTVYSAAAVCIMKLWLIALDSMLGLRHCHG